MTFVDYAELVWRRLASGETQQQVADSLGWSREAVKDYASLRKIAPEAWAAVGATVRDQGLVRQSATAPENGAVAPFTENLLRSVTQLRPEQQLELVKRLARGKCSKGRAYGKGDHTHGQPLQSLRRWKLPARAYPFSGSDVNASSRPIASTIWAALMSLPWSLSW